MRKQPECIEWLVSDGISADDAMALRRISMTLHRWHEGECGDSSQAVSWCITRGNWVNTLENGLTVIMRRKVNGAVFEYDDDGDAYLERHFYNESGARYTRIPDRERGAQKRLKAIMARYPGFTAYVQGDPRGCALYILRPDDLKLGDDVSSVYTRGIAVYK